MSGLDPGLPECDQATGLVELRNPLGRKLYRGVMDFRVASECNPSLLALLEVCWRGPIVEAEDASGISHGPEDWQGDINGAHTAETMSMGTVLAFGHTGEVEEFDGDEIEDWTLYIVRLGAGGPPGVFLNADTTPVFGWNYKRYQEQAHRLLLVASLASCDRRGQIKNTIYIHTQPYL